MIKWLNSVRAIALIIFVAGLTIGFLSGRLEANLYLAAGMIALNGYFSKRDDIKNQQP